MKASDDTDLSPKFSQQEINCPSQEVNNLPQERKRLTQIQHQQTEQQDNPNRQNQQRKNNVKSAVMLIDSQRSGRK